MTTTNLQPDDATGIDTYIKNTTPSVNYATAVEMLIGQLASGSVVARGLIKFAGLSDGTVPADAIVSACTLSLWYKTDLATKGCTLKVYRVKKNWTEDASSWNAVTWNVIDGTIYWSVPGSVNPDDYEATEIGSATITASETPDTELQISLTPALIQEMACGAWTDYGFLIKSSTEDDDQYSFHSSGSTTAGYRPKLSVTYTQHAYYSSLSGVLTMAGGLVNEALKALSGALTLVGVGVGSFYTLIKRKTSSNNRRITSSGAYRVVNEASISYVNLSGAISSIVGGIVKARTFTIGRIVIRIR